MAAKRLWGVIGFCAFAVFAAITLARAADEAQPADFLILAVKPEGDLKDYRLIPVGEASVDPVQYRDVVASLPRSLFGGVMIPPHDERAELAQCRTACAANAKCGNFTYVRPGKDRPVGVCHLRRAVEAPSAVVMAPPVVERPPQVVENAAPGPELVVVSPVVRNERKLISIDSARNGRSFYTPDQAPVSPVTFRFKVPVASAKADVRTFTRDRIWANVEALDLRGRVFKRSGTWIAADGAAHQILVRTDDNRIAAVRISTRIEGALRVDGVDFVRAAATIADTAPVDDEAALDEEEANIPPPVPQFVAEQSFPMPPRAEATDAPVAIAATDYPAPVETTVTDLPADGAAETSITIPIKPAEAVPAASETAAAPVFSEPTLQSEQPPDLAILAAAGAFVFVVGGAGLYRQNYRRRTLRRLTTTVVTNGRVRPAVTLSTEQPDMSLRFAVRAYASAGARQTSIIITPDGAAA
jgi:hypothetical protein